jgi:uncharacterized repeat protein (TIGR03806 family)
MQAVGFLLSACGGSDAQPDTPPPPTPVDTTAPSVPSGIVASATSPTSVSITWTASTDTGAGATGIGGYRVYRDGGANALGSTTTTTFVDSTASPNTLYNYTVEAYDRATTPNVSVQSGPVSATTPAAQANDTTPPTAPTNVAAVAVVGSSTQIALTWTASTDASGISVYRVLRNGTQVGTTQTTTYTDNGLAPATAYTYTVFAVDAATPPNVSAASVTASATTNAATADTTPPAAPTAVSAAPLSDTSIRVSWAATADPSGIREYRVYRGTGASPTLVATVLPTVALTFVDTGLTAATAYTYTVRAVDDSPAQNVSAASTAATATTNAAPPPPDDDPPTVPGAFTAIAAGTTSIRLNWTASTDASGIFEYRIFRDGGASPIAQLGSTVTTYTDSGRTPGTTYTYAIFAVDNAVPANVSASATASATTNTAPDTLAPTVPTNLVANVLSSSSIRLTWTASTDTSGISGYRVYRDGAQIGIAATPVYTDSTGLAASTTYTYTVAAVDASPQTNISAQSASVMATTNNIPPDTTPPSAPTGVTAVAQSSSAILVSWSASTDTESGISAYRVFRNGSATALTTVTGATLSYTDTQLTGSTTYTYTVRAVDGAPTPNVSAASAVASATTLATPDVTPPTVPMNVVATALTASTIRITWSPSTDDSGIAGYSVFRAGTATPVATLVQGTAFTDTGLTASTLYTYTVRATDNAAPANVSAASASASATTLATPPPVDTTPPSVPTGVTATAPTSTTVLVSWTASTDNASGIASYRVFRNGGATPIATVTAPTTNYTDTGLIGGTTYTYRVSAVDGAPVPNVSAQSSAASATPPDATAPSVPTGLTATAQDSTTVLLSWAASSDVSGISGYRVYRGGTLITTVATNSYTDNGLVGGTLYSYTVSAVDNSPALNASAQSSAVTVRPPDSTAPTVPGGVTAVAQSNTSILVSWNASTDASGIAGYRVYRGGTLLNTGALVTATNYTDTGLTAATLYSYTVAAVDASAQANASAQSGAASATTTGGSTSGLDSRPSNTTCLAGDAPSTGSLSIAVQPAFPNVNLSQPVKMLQAPQDGSRWFAVQQGGIVKVWNNTANASDSVFVDITSRVAALETESGFLGMAFHPNWPSDPRVYLSYNAQNGSQEVSRISEFRSTNGGATLDANSEVILLSVNQPDTNHKGGDIAFGQDGNLYISFGDGGNADDFGNGHNAIGNGQYLGTLLGKMLRISVGVQGAAYTIPVDNPYAGGPRAVGGSCSGNCPEIYAYGFRNPWRWSFDKMTGEMWVGDVGQNTYEEVDRVVKGGNYGWRCREGAHAFSSSCGPNGPGLPPIAEYTHDNGGFAVTGGFVYRGTAIPALIGRYVFADYGSGNIWTIPNNQTATLTVTDSNALASGYSLAGFGEGADGELYIVDWNDGDIGKIVPGSGGGGGRVIPTLLSQTGCVNASNPTLPATGMIPYAPNAPFFSDGAGKQRWLALPNGTQVTVETSNDFTFPIGSVLMKNFTLGSTLVETRLFMRHTDGNWAGYTYEWNAGGTDATRVIGGKTVAINGQTWEFPSESQCLTCHTAAAGRTLGPEIGSFNGDLLYPLTGRTANQLTTHNFIGTLTPALTQPASALPVIPNPFGTAPLADRARAYLHANCSYCHQPGGPTSVNLDFRYTTTLLNTNACEVAPTAGDLGITNPRRIAVGEAARSVVVSRVNRTDANAMPPLMRHTIDTAGVALLTTWVNGLTSCN